LIENFFKKRFLRRRPDLIDHYKKFISKRTVVGVRVRRVDALRVAGRGLPLVHRAAVIREARRAAVQGAWK